MGHCTSWWHMNSGTLRDAKLKAVICEGSMFCFMNSLAAEDCVLQTGQERAVLFKDFFLNSERSALQLVMKQGYDFSP